MNADQVGAAKELALQKRFGPRINTNEHESENQKAIEVYYPETISAGGRGEVSPP
jgi:hypothetical protein